MAYAVKPLLSFCADVMRKAGLGEGEARLFAKSLLDADMRGIASHGISRLRTYAKRVETGVVAKDANIRIVGGAPGFLHIDGANGLGSTIGVAVMDTLMERARETGACAAAVFNGNHFGIGAFHTLYAAEKGFIALAASNAPASVVPTGGRKPLLGTNPLSIAVPAGKHPPLVLDMASSTVAQGKVILAQKEGKPIPEGWAVDAQGLPTTDPDAALKGAMLPFGGPKGYAIALIIDILCASLSGANGSMKINNFWNDFENPQNLGYFMSVYHVESLMPLADFVERVDAVFDEIKASEPAEGSEIFIPGEIEHRAYERSLADGISLGDAVVTDLRKLADEYGIRWPFE